MSGPKQLVLAFLAWKTLLLIMACASPGVGYDTSTRILFDHAEPAARTWMEHAIEHATLRLTRWDGIYFATLADRGHVNEQDWAFSWALARFVDLASSILFRWLPASTIVKRALCGALVSHIAHFFTVAILFYLTLELLPPFNRARQRIAFTAALLHIISPGGIFLSAHNAESIFACINFAGTLSYVHAVKMRYSNLQYPLLEATHTIAAGVFFGGSSMLRSNGLLSGIVFAWDALEAILQPRVLFNDTSKVTRLLLTGFAGSLVGIGYAIPQAVAYVEYCTGHHQREWCQGNPPSIYSWVQSHYWGVGFLKYWTLSNGPLFLLATPMIVVLLATGALVLREPQAIFGAPRLRVITQTQATENETEGGEALASLYRRLAVPQLVLAIMAMTSFHVQIINRISSGYPVWYIVLAVWLESSRADEPTIKTQQRSTGNLKETKTSLRANLLSPERRKAGLMQWAVRGMMMYAIIQGGLYACFLPPA